MASHSPLTPPRVNASLYPANSSPEKCPRRRHVSATAAPGDVTARRARSASAAVAGATT